MKLGTITTPVLLLCCLVGSLSNAAERDILPTVSFADVPLYPPAAWVTNTSGMVHVVVTTDGHKVVTARAQDGNKLLRDAAERNAKSWQLGTHEPTSFTLTYIYRLVDGLKPQGNNSKVILQLPIEVEVDAQPWPGTKDMPADLHDSRHAPNVPKQK